MTPVTEHDWYAWHYDYDHPDTALARRLAAVQGAGPRRAGRGRSSAPLRAISLCAGQGRDLIGALAGHPRRHDVRARLVELDPRNADRARQAARAAGLPGVEGGDRRRGADRRLRRDDARLAGPGLRRVRQHNQRGRRAHGGLLHQPVPGAARWSGRRPLAPDSLPRICAWFTDRGFDRLWVSDRPRAGAPPPTASPARRNCCRTGAAPSPSAAITHVPVPLGIFLYLPNEAWYLPPVRFPPPRLCPDRLPHPHRWSGTDRPQRGSGLRTEEPLALCYRRRLSPVGGTEFGHDVRHVDTGGLGRDEQVGGDVAVGPPGGDQAQHLELAIGQPEPAGLAGVLASSVTPARRASEVIVSASGRAPS